jgi:putative ABC transport system permease protein
VPDWSNYVRQNLRLPTLRPEREAEIVEDLSRQLDDAYREALSGGATEGEARARAEKHVDDWKELSRELAASPHEKMTRLERWQQNSADASAKRGRFTMLDVLKQDVIYGMRVLRKSPGFMLTSVVILALGIGANTAIFSVVNAVLLRPLPFQDPERLVKVMHVPPAKSFPGISVFAVSPANYLDWQKENDVFEEMAAYGSRSMKIANGNQTEAVQAAMVAPSFFTILRARPEIGRLFDSDDDQPGHGNVVILSHSYWQSHLGSDPNVVNQTLKLNGLPYAIVGVMPAQLEFSAWSPTAAQIWVPLAWTDKQRAVRGDHNYNVAARMKPGISAGRAQAEMDAISHNLERRYPEEDQGWGAIVQPLHGYLVSGVRPALLILLGAVAFVLLIACANVANLILAKTLGRSKEMAIRAALGAARSRLVRQLLVETLLLSLAGGLAGLLFAHYGVSLIVDFLGNNLPRATEIGLDRWVLVFTLGVSVLTGVVAGLAPALRFSRADLNQALKQGSSRTDSDSGGNRTRSVLAVCEVSLSLVLLIAAGLMIRTLWALQKVDPGFDSRNLLTMTVVIPATKYADAVQQNAFYEQTLGRVRALQGVEFAAATDGVPLLGGSTQPIAIEGRPPVPASEQPEVATRVITTDYLRTMRIPLMRGRDFDDSDIAGRKAVIMISETAAKRFWPGEDPIGKRLTLTFSPESKREIVGIVGDIKDRGLDALEPVATLYVPFSQMPNAFMNLVVRTATPPMSVVPAIASEVHRIDAEQPVQNVTTMEQIIEQSISQQRFNMLLLGAFAVLAVILAAVGIYGVLAYSVRRRVREIGIRMALGARTADVLRLIVADGMKPVLIGVGIGLGASLLLGQVMTKLVYGVSVFDPVTIAAVSVLLAGVAFLACIIPAVRAMKVNPIVALRDE